MAGVVAQYNSVPRLRNVITNNVINPVGGSNPADLGPVRLSNIRGQVTITIISGDNSFTSMFDIVGGFGEFPDQWSQDWYPQAGTEINCTIRVLQENRIQVTTPVADAGGRVYIFEFVPLQSFGPTIRQNSVNIIGNNTLTIRMVKKLAVQGF